MNTRVVCAILFVGLMIVAAGCVSVKAPVPVPAAPPCELDRGESTALTITGAEDATSLEWSASMGQLTPNQGPAVTYTAPRDYSGPVVITVIARKGNAQEQGQMTCTILPPPPTPTLEPTATVPPTPTDTPTPTPGPQACDIRTTTQSLFPQMFQTFGVDGQFPIHGPVEGAGSENFHCEVVTDLVHNGPLAVHIKYDKVTDNSGWWGIATPNGYDASQHNQFCFWVYARQPASFRVKMKDRSVPEKKEAGPAFTITKTNVWEQSCTDISTFAEMGINTKQMDNVNLGFEPPLGPAEVWVADLEFK